MKNYDDMSDFEINRLTAYALDLNGGEEGYFDGVPQLVPDFCNNPSDAWPIIVENKIGFQFFGDDWLSFIHNVASNKFTHNKNPLRAAMICFLKMKESEQ